MGLFDTVLIDERIEVPKYPEPHEGVKWQSKSIGRPSMSTYRISSEKRLEKKQQTYRDKTEKEKQEMVEEMTDYDSWKEWEESDSLGPMSSWETTVDEEWWSDTNHHGTFEFHHVVREDPQSYNEGGFPTDYATKEYWSFEARFTKGDLDEIVHLKTEDLSS